MRDLVNHPLVETEWLAEHLHDADLRIVDARWRGNGSGRSLYLDGHIPGAVHLDWDLDLSQSVNGVRNMLLPGERFAAVMESVGVGDETLVVAYAETDHSGAARLWWALRYYGHKRVAVLNGGFSKWQAEGRPVAAQTPSLPLARFTPRPQPQWLATAAEIESRLSIPGAEICLIDTRPREQYLGEAIWTPEGSLYPPAGQDWVEFEGRQRRAGRIKGAVHLHASDNLEPTTWRYKTPEALRQRAMAVGASPEQRVITYCGVGISASLGLFALYLAGYRDLALYDGSWDEWSSDPGRPIERDRANVRAA
jgi:thiosulfate/3-mercaptopyruvate sulfurtransferase